MGQRTRWLPVVAGLALAFIAVGSAVQAVVRHSWGPITDGILIPAVIVVACWPGASRRCLPRRGRPAG